MSKSVFYSFSYDRDVHRVQLVRHINALDSQPFLKSQEWEKVRGGGKQAIKDWIDAQMAYKRAVIVLIGQDTAGREWVNYEIEKAWSAKKPLLGVRIHGLSSMGSIDRAGADPFAGVTGVSGVPIFDPTTKDWVGRIDSQGTYSKLVSNLEGWADQGKVRAG